MFIIPIIIRVERMLLIIEDSIIEMVPEITKAIPVFLFAAYQALSLFIVQEVLTPTTLLHLTFGNMFFETFSRL